MMKRFRSVLGMFVAACFLFQGCAQSQKVMATQGTVDLPYDSLGTLEVYEKVRHQDSSRIGLQLLSLLTFGKYKVQARKDVYQRVLMDKLAEEAKRKYGADQVIHVEFWPALDSEVFPREGTLYARGEMIRWREFTA